MQAMKHLGKRCKVTNKFLNIRTFGTAQLQLSQPQIDIKYTQLFINGKFVDSVSGKTMPTIDPRTEESIVNVAEAQIEDVDIAVSTARKAFDSGIWSSLSGFERNKILCKVAELIEKPENAETLSKLETLDVGKPLFLSQGDVSMTADAFRYYGGWADKIGGKTISCNSAGGQKKFAYTLHEPIGVVGAITPWNAPLGIFAIQLAAALATGNTFVLKAAETAPLSALYLAQLLTQAGVPDGVVNVVPGIGETAGHALASHAGIDKITFTGETTTGISVMKAAANNLTPVTLELGGKSPLIICNDADMDQAVFISNFGLFVNSGQICCASTRIFVEDGIYDEYMEKQIAMTKQRRVGDPFGDVDQGPQQNGEVFKKALSYIESGKNEGATCMLGGNRIGNRGYYIEPTIFGDVKDDMKIAKDEIFGPVMQVMRFSDFDDVIRRANNTTYGLAAGILSKNIDRINQATRALKAGSVWVNTWDVFDMSLPFGGYRKSGIGRAKGEYALENFTEVKAVVQNLQNDGGWY